MLRPIDWSFGTFCCLYNGPSNPLCSATRLTATPIPSLFQSVLSLIICTGMSAVTTHDVSKCISSGMCSREWYGCHGPLHPLHSFFGTLQQGRSVQRLRSISSSSIYPDRMLTHHPQHFVVVYYTGERFDCGKSDCKLSKEHMHKTAKECFCNSVSVRFLCGLSVAASSSQS